MLSKVKFPLYRINAFGKSYYKINSEHQFDELQLVGEKVTTFLFQAKTFFDYQLIQDMIDCKDGNWIEISLNDYSEPLSKTSQV